MFFLNASDPQLRKTAGFSSFSCVTSYINLIMIYTLHQTPFHSCWKTSNVIMSYPSLAYKIFIVWVMFWDRIPAWWSSWCGLVASRPSACSLAFSGKLCSFSARVQQWARITMMPCQGRENGSPRLTNSSLNLLGFSENGKTLLTY